MNDSICVLYQDKETISFLSDLFAGNKLIQPQINNWKQFQESDYNIGIKNLYENYKVPCLLEINKLILNDGTRFFLQNSGEYLNYSIIHDAPAILSIELIYYNGIETKTFQGDIPGKFLKHSESKLNWKKSFYPDGYTLNYEQILELKHVVTKKNRLLFDLANFLGLPYKKEIYESHITIDSSTCTYEEFQRVCNNLGIKAIKIELPQGISPTHLITAAFHKGTFEKVKKEIHYLVERLNSQFIVLRYRIEAMVNNLEYVPQIDEEALKRPYNQYFEYHTKVFLHEEEDITLLRERCVGKGAHLSRNPTKKIIGGTQWFATLRYSNVGVGNANKRFDEFLNYLRSYEYQLSNILKEYVIFDSNPLLDKGWGAESWPANTLTYLEAKQEYCANNCEGIICQNHAIR